MYFYPLEFWTTCVYPEKQSLPWKFCLHWNKHISGTWACSENRVFPEIFHCIEYSFYIQDFWATCAFPEKQSVPWIHCVEYIFFIIQNFEQPALALKTEFALKFFPGLKYFSSTRRKPSKNYTCFISRRFGLFLIHLQSKSFFDWRWIKNNPKRLEIKHV